jgi:hypothetical protein
MTSFEAGFYKYAEEYGLPHTEAVYIYKRALEYPPTQEMFKKLPEDTDSAESPSTLANLAEMMKQHILHEAMDADTKKIQL